MTDPYYSDSLVTLYCGDMLDILPTLGQFDAAICDPPYGVTAHRWDRWIDGWPELVAQHTNSLWCFGSARMFLDHAGDFAAWRFSHDRIWEKHNGTGAATDRFRNVHEHMWHWYRGPWAEVYTQVPREPAVYTRGGDKSVARSFAGEHHGKIGAHYYADDGTRLARSVIKCPSVRGGLHKTEKPGKVLADLVVYSVPPGGVVLDPTAGSCSTLLAARRLSRRAVGIEVDEALCERVVAERLAVPDLFGGAA